jgi:glycosyltransferase involved in cell wall biosynthesis
VRVTLVHPFRWPEVRRGAERYVDDLARYLAAHDHVVTVVTGTNGPDLVEHGSDGVTTVQRTQIRARGMRRVGLGEVETFGLAALGPIRRSEADVVHAMTPSAALAARLAGRRTLFTILGHPDPEQMPAALIPRHLFLGALRAATTTTVLSGASRLALERLTGRSAVVLPPGVSLERFTPAAPAAAQPPRILFSGSLADARKRPDLAVAAFALVLERHPGARLAVSGAGDTEAVLTLAGRVSGGASEAVEVLGPGRPEDVPQRYREATVTVLPAEHEAFGLVLVESLASGTPVVCTPSGGMPEIVTPEVGVVAQSFTAHALADALEAAILLASDPSTAQRCVARARLWDWGSTVGPAHVELYERLAVGRPDTSPLGPW